MGFFASDYAYVSRTGHPQNVCESLSKNSTQAQANTCQLRHKADRLKVFCTLHPPPTKLATGNASLTSCLIHSNITTGCTNSVLLSGTPQQFTFRSVRRGHSLTLTMTVRDFAVLSTPGKGAQTLSNTDQCGHGYREVGWCKVHLTMLATYCPRCDVLASDEDKLQR